MEIKVGEPTEEGRFSSILQSRLLRYARALLVPIEVECEIVNRSYLKCQEFFALKEVMQISAGVAVVDRCRAFRIDGREVVRPFGVAEIDNALPGEDLSVAAVARRHDAVEHIDTAFDAFENVHRRTHAHQVARAVFGVESR